MLSQVYWSIQLPLKKELSNWGSLGWRGTEAAPFSSSLVYCTLQWPNAGETFLFIFKVKYTTNKIWEQCCACVCFPISTKESYFISISVKPRLETKNQWQLSHLPLKHLGSNLTNRAYVAPWNYFQWMGALTTWWHLRANRYLAIV